MSQGSGASGVKREKHYAVNGGEVGSALRPRLLGPPVTGLLSLDPLVPLTKLEGLPQGVSLDSLSHSDKPASWE